MTRRNHTLLVTVALLVSACSTTASEQAVELSPEHPLLGMLETQTSVSPLSADTLLAARWQFPLTLANAQNDKVTVTTCNALSEAHGEGFGASEPSGYGLLQASLALCQATADTQALQSSTKNYLPEPILSPRFPMVAPAALAVVVSDQEQKKAAQSQNWQEFSALRDYQSTGPYDATYISEDGAIQRVFLLATGDFNGDDVKDAILYLESSLEEGSYNTARYLVVTRETADGPMNVLKSVWPGVQESGPQPQAGNGGTSP